MMLVVDTNAYTAFCRGIESVINAFEEADALIVPSIVAGELYSRFMQGNRREANWREFNTFLSQNGISLQSIGQSEAEKYALLVKNLKEAGTPVPTNDIWIAATALVSGAAVIARDAHFNYIKGVFVVGY
jgi:tRNA(fMet)-specific endonuclease VapC